MKNWKRRCPPRSPRRQDLKRPLSGVSRHWHVLRVPEERAGRSKVLAAKDSVESWARCRWANERSVVRYERPARLAESAQGLPVGVEEFCRQAEEHFNALIVGRVTPGLLAMPPR